MRSPIQSLAVLSCAVLLAACGGGGATPPAAPNPPSADAVTVTLTPSPAPLVAYAGEPLAFGVTAMASRDLDLATSIQVSEPNGVLDPAVDIARNPMSAREWNFKLRTLPTLAVGTHTTTLEVRMCQDDARTCAKPLPGSPWRLPLQVEVKPAAAGAGRFTVTPASVDATAYEDDATAFRLTFVAQAATLPALGGSVVDPKGLFAPATFAMTGGSYQNGSADLAPATPLQPGTYDTTLQVKVCLDDPAQCKSPLAGSPYAVPVHLTVKPKTHLTALFVLPLAGPWSNAAGDAARTAYVHASFDPARFERRWDLAVHRPAGGTLAVAGGRVFATVYAGGPGGVNLAAETVAIDERTGQIAWHAPLGALTVDSQVAGPATGAGNVYATSTGATGKALWVFDAATGRQLRRQTVETQAAAYDDPALGAPTTDGTTVYARIARDGSLSRFDTAGGAAWNAPLPAYGAWSPAVDATRVYGYLDQLVALDTASGKTAFTVKPAGGAATGYAGEVVLDGASTAFVANTANLGAFDIAKASARWWIAGSGRLAYGNDTLYVLGGTLDARNPANGNLLWSVDLPQERGAGFTSIVATDNLAFVASATQTLAIDLATRKTVWAYPKGGALAISDRGVLYIYGGDDVVPGFLQAINLR